MNILTKRSFDIVKDRRFYTNILLMSVPIILQQLLRVSVDTADSIMLGNIEQSHMAAVSQAKQIFFVFYTMCNGFATGASVLISQHWGKNETDRIRTLFVTGIKNIAVFSLIISVLIFIFPEYCMRILSNDPYIISLGREYLRLSVFSYLPCAVSTMLFACCRGVEQIKISFTANAVSYPVNVFLNYCLIFGKLGMPELGIEGAAIGTIISRLVELCILIIFVFKYENRVNLRIKDFKLSDKRLTKLFFLISLPIVAHEFIWSTGTSAGSAITGQMGKEVVAGFSVAYMLYQLIASFMNSIMYTCSVVVGKEIGKGTEKKELKTVANSMLFIGTFGGTVLGIITLMTATPFIDFYVLTETAKTYAGWFMVIFAVIWPFSGLEMTGMIATLRAGGDGKTGFITDIFSMWVFTIPLAILGGFVLNWSPVIVIAVIKFNIIIEAVVGFIRVHSMKWVRNLTEA